MRPNEAGLEGRGDTAGSDAAGTPAGAGTDRALSAETAARAAGAEEARYLTTSPSSHEFCITAAAPPQRCETRN